MINKICIFAGTTEGRQLAEKLRKFYDLTVCVATDYGEVLLDDIKNINIHTGRMNKEGIEAFIKDGQFDLVIDATHPYATEATENIKAAAESTGTRLIRIIRSTDERAANAVSVNTAEEACEYLKGTEGNILFTTGAKDLTSFSGLDMSRVWARVLPLDASLKACEKAGIIPSHIIAAQGPFTEAVNIAQIQMIDAKYIVTKASGKAGGFDEKIAAARKAGATPVIIGLPPQTEGITIKEALKELKHEKPERKISIIGIGPGAGVNLTKEAKHAIRNADLILGAKSVTDTIDTGKPVVNEYLPDKVRAEIDKAKENEDIENIAILMRGDVGFFSGAKKLSDAIPDATLIPGIASPVIFAARLCTSWDDAALISTHGRDENPILKISRNKKTFILTGGNCTPKNLIDKLMEYGYSDLTVTVGENLSYENEKITTGTAAELKGREFDFLSIMLVENPDAEKCIATGLPDDVFIRGDVPMTKAEIRAVSVSKLGIRNNSVVWDVGAGTGSVSIECALLAEDGKIYAVEKKPEAIKLIKQNRLKFRTDNLIITEGFAPEALADLPAPDCVFIGGSSGNLDSIVDAVLAKNPHATIVINAITLETQAEALALASRFNSFEAVSLSISRSRSAGSYHLMNALNPVMVITVNR